MRPDLLSSFLSNTESAQMFDGFVLVKNRRRVEGAQWQESEHAEAFTPLTDGQLQHLVQLLVGVVCREAQLVKTGRRRERERKKQLFHFCFQYFYMNV